MTSEDVYNFNAELEDVSGEWIFCSKHQVNHQKFHFLINF